MNYYTKSFFKRILPAFVYQKCGEWYPKLTFPIYKGDKYHCVLCGKKSRKFLPVGFKFPVLVEKNIIGGVARENAQCPYCYADDRERLVFRYLQLKTDLFKTPHRIPHVAPEKNIQKNLKKSAHIEYISADLNSDIADLRMDITNIFFKNNWFDSVICNHVLEHVPQDEKAMQELFRVLKPGSWAILQVPISSILTTTFEDWTVVRARDRERLFGQRDHVRIYARDYKERLEKVGFKVGIFNYAQEFGEELCFRNAINKMEDLYVGFKPVESKVFGASPQAALGVSS